MRLSNKILLVWLAVMWIVFSIWVFAVTQFPLNFGFVGLQSLTGVVLMWTMLQYRDI
ncbi:MAG: hypothetical protein O2V44_02635 [Candidatus Bathyarchaeota archaeon]|nr:hypothetical protein [Candidatus Bathyarchaeota archaeon]